jgi:hypothetical protein
MIVSARGWEAAWSQVCTEVTRGSVTGVRPSESRGGTGLSHTRGAPGTVMLARSNHDWLVQVIAVSYIYIYIYIYNG